MNRIAPTLLLRALVSFRAWNVPIGNRQAFVFDAD